MSFERQNRCGDINLKKTQLSDYDIWQVTMAINGYTRDLHTEEDCTYTLIHVPRLKTTKVARLCSFQFALDNKCKQQSVFLLLI